MKQNLKIASLLKGNFGIEKETLRVYENGKIASTDHPFQGRDSHIYIKNDFGEQQVEVITGVHNSIEKAVNELKLLTNIVYRKMPQDEYIWPYSMPLGPFTIDKMSKVKGEGRKYREYLAQKTNIKMQLISGIHFNWSLAKDVTNKMSKEEINEFYFNIFKRYKHSYFVINKLFADAQTPDFKVWEEESYRLGSSGYKSNFTFTEEDFSCYECYRKAINKLIENKVINHWRENYDSIRVKPFDVETIEYIEIRNIDLWWQDEYGINEEAFDFIHKYLIYLSQNEIKIDFDWIINDFLRWIKENELGHQKYQDLINKHLQPKTRPTINGIIETQKQLKEKVTQIPLLPVNDMELSTQILIEEAITQGYEVKIIDRKSNTIAINGHILKQATLNDFDSKKGLEIIDSKIKTNQFLRKHKFKCPLQESFTNVNQAYEFYQQVANQKIVVKPESTNFSVGITIFNESFSEAEFKKAIDKAFKHDQRIIVENFVSGQEYRLMVINQEFVGTLKRIPANVIGDGKNNIKKLVDIKNQSYLRGQGYKLPLEKIKLEEVEIEYLKQQNLTTDFVPQKDQRVFLRHNSNVSTGGDTIDVSDQINPFYKDLAVKITKDLDLEICGLDIIIPDIENKDDYAILELNWNPAIHIHTYPLVGKNRYPAKYILKMIDKFSK